MEKFKVLLVDDHADFRRVVHDFLKKLPNVSTISEAADGEEAIQKANELHPDIILMDISMPLKSGSAQRVESATVGGRNISGLEATRVIKQRQPTTKVIIATMHNSPAYRSQALEAKADGFILKSSLKPSLEAIFGSNHDNDSKTSEVRKSGRIIYSHSTLLRSKG